MTAYARTSAGNTAPPPVGNANYAWLQHILHHLSPTGTAGVVLANGSMSSTQSGEGDIRKAMVEGDVVDCMIALPGQLFYSTQIPVCLWFLARDKKNHKFRDRRGEVLFIDARKLGHMVDRTRKEFSDETSPRSPAPIMHGAARKTRSPSVAPMRMCRGSARWRRWRKSVRAGMC